MTEPSGSRSPLVLTDETSYVTREVTLVLKVRVTLNDHPHLEVEVRDGKGREKEQAAAVVAVDTVPRRLVMLAHGWALGESPECACLRLAISRSTHSRLSRVLFDTLGVSSRAEAVAVLVGAGIISREESLIPLAKAEADARDAFTTAWPASQAIEQSRPVTSL